MIAAKNEADMIRDAINSATSISDDVVVIDDESTDNTAEIAKQLGARVFARKLDGFATQKNFGISKTRHDWVLVLDADERVSQELAQNIRALKSKKKIAGYKIAFRNHIGEKWLKYGGMYPDYHIRLFNKQHARYGQREIHEELEINGDVGRIDGDIIHFTYANYREYLHKVKKYSALEAGTIQYKIRFRAVVKEFLVRYVKLSGWKDGWSGLVSACLLTYYKWRLCMGTST